MWGQLLIFNPTPSVPKKSHFRIQNLSLKNVILTSQYNSQLSLSYTTPCILHIIYLFISHYFSCPTPKMILVFFRYH
jgi:hypothetical protein